MIDSHCHLAAKEFAEDLPAVLQRAKERGVTAMVCIGDTLAESVDCVRLAQANPELYATVGIHPHAAKEWKDGDADRLWDLARSSPKVRAIGEIGLDYHYDLSPRDIQREVFRNQMALARDSSLPAVVHCREAVHDLREILLEMQASRFVIHCCSEVYEDVEPLVRVGCFLSFTGIATYKSAHAIRDTITRCPIEQMMIETDAPYLAPVPHRGQRNEPAFVAEVLKLVAELKGMPVPDAENILTENTVRFFGLPETAAL